MATSILTDCSSFQGSTTSSSSDMMTGTTAASSWCAIPTSTRIRMIRLFRPHTRRMLVTPSATPSYGFSVRGGKEYSTGFFVSTVDRNSEAEQKGLRIGDQILRINGFRIDDAIHKEFCQLVTSQDRLVLKVRSVGMLPTKDKETDGLSWSVVKTASISSTPSECSYQSSTSTEHSTLRNRNERVINIVLNVAPRTKLGLGICKGPEWKPGIFVQFTKEKSVAREAGLRPGDQILTVNSIDFSDVLFSEAVAVMKSSNKLDMTVHKGAGCDLFPGESSGYNSSASSVTGDQSPCWGDVKSKRLTSVREESSVAPPSPPHTSAAGKHNTWNQTLYENEPRIRSKSNVERYMKPSALDSNLATRPANTMASTSMCHKEINKTIIKLSESGTSINNTFVATHISSSGSHSEGIPNSDYNAATLTKTNQPVADANSTIPPVPPPIAIQNPAPTPTMQHTSSGHSAAGPGHLHKDGNIKLGGLASTMQRYASLGNYVAINELPSSHNHNQNQVHAHSHTHTMSNESREPPPPPSQNDGDTLSNAITEELKKRKAKRQQNCQPSQRSDGLNNNHNLLTAMHANGAGPSEQKTPKSQNTLTGAGDQHSALMNEFKQAHKRMFRNGFKDTEPGESKDRQEALNRTTMMDDPTTYRAKGTKQSKFETIENHREQSRQEDGNNNNNNNNDINSNNTNSHIPKPPPMQLLSSSSSSHSSTNNLFKTQNLTQKSQMFNTQASPSSSSLYSNDQHNGVALRSASSSSNGTLAGALGSETQYRHSNRSSATALAMPPPSNNRQTLRLGTVTIGEYHHLSARKEPEKFDFIASGTKRNESGDTTPTNETLQSELHSTLARSKFKKSNGSALEHQRNCPLHQSQQQQLQPPAQRHHHHHNHHQQHHQHPPQQQQQQPQQYEYQNVNFNTFTVSEMAKKLQKTSLNGGGPANGGGGAANPSSSSSFNATTGNHHTSTAGGILKNGNRNNSNSSNSNKSTEKSIKFG